MAWGKFDDGLDDHPKMIAAGSDAICLWFVSILYSNRHFTDGFIPYKKVRGFNTVSHPLKSARTLVRVGLWETVPGGYKIHDFHTHNPHAADVKAKLEADRIRKQNARLSTRTHRGRPDGQSADVPQTSEWNPRASRARDPNPNPNPNPKKKEQAAANGGGTQKSPAPSRHAAAASRTKPAHTNGNGSRRPGLLFKGRRFVVFPWMDQDFQAILGQYYDAFDLPAWFKTLDDELVANGRTVLTKDERWPYIQRALKAEIARRGLPMLRTDAPFTKAEIERADSALKRVYFAGCPHEPRCANRDACKAELIFMWRDQLRDAMEGKPH